MRLLAAILAGLIVLHVPSIGYGLNPEKLKVNGVDGIWLPNAEMSQLTQQAERGQLAEDIVKLQEDQIERYKVTVKTATEALDLSKRLTAVQTERADQLAQAIKDSTPSALDRVVTSPILWTVVGVLGGLGLGYAVFHGQITVVR